MKHYDTWRGHDYLPPRHASSTHASVDRSSVKHTSMLALLLMLMALPHADANSVTDDCVSCDAGKYAPMEGSEACLACGAGTYGLVAGQLTCLECGAGTYPEEFAYKGWCSVRLSTFIITNSIESATMYSGPGNATWFDIALETVSLRAILDSVRTDWAVGTQVRVGSALGQAGALNPVVLRRIGINGQGLWSPANVNPMHTTNSTRYYMLL